MAELEVASIERATLAAVPPQAVEEAEGWLLAFDGGTVGRAHSAAPLHHTAPAPGIAQRIEQRYAQQRLPPVLRLPQLPCFDALRADLAARGYKGTKPTLVQVAECDRVAALGAEVQVTFTASPTARWADVFLGEGFDPVDGASRLEVLGRAATSLFATVSVQGEVAAVGSGCYSHGWCGIHGMRTLPAFRGRGFAGGILAALAREALARGIARAFLQVEQGNARAQALYARAGFENVWAYEYWAAA